MYTNILPQIISSRWIKKLKKFILLFWFLEMIDLLYYEYQIYCVNGCICIEYICFIKSVENALKPWRLLDGICVVKIYLFTPFFRRHYEYLQYFVKEQKHILVLLNHYTIIMELLLKNYFRRLMSCMSRILYMNANKNCLILLKLILYFARKFS